jgi:hypothetical protein
MDKKKNVEILLSTYQRQVKEIEIQIREKVAEKQTLMTVIDNLEMAIEKDKKP